MVNIMLLAVPVKNASALKSYDAYCAVELYGCIVGLEKMFHVILFGAE